MFSWDFGSPDSTFKSPENDVDDDDAADGDDGNTVFFRGLEHDFIQGACKLIKLMKPIN